MRYLTIILAVAFGMMLSWIMLLNPQIVPVRLITTDIPVSLDIGPVHEVAQRLRADYEHEYDTY